ncbi:Peroxisome biogenesis factor 2 [Merluccius polli]|uniref:Peroxisome biogenesis factor 2 n=1 Tax=Merluccius polli TaxID=89951 RepID=A0AA47NRP2_MERPO|nr:Peroxisome biogenesis factor 2 [Merluccius polli]
MALYRATEMRVIRLLSLPVLRKLPKPTERTRATRAPQERPVPCGCGCHHQDVLTVESQNENFSGSGSDGGADPQIPVLRINQLDAFELDSSLEQLLWAQFTQCFKSCRPGLLTPVEPELKALLQLLLWRFTLYSNSATVGQALLSLRYHNHTAAAAAAAAAAAPSSSSTSRRYRPLTRGQKLGLALLTVGPRWLRERSHALLLFLGLSSGVGPPTPNGALLRRSLALLSGLAQIAGLLNFLVFLRNGRHPALAERVVGARAVFSQPNAGRDVGYRHMNRELLWHGFAEFLVFLLPLVNFRKVKAAFYSLVLGRQADRPGAGAGGVAWKECGFCGEWPTMPHTVGCGHIFCYYCVKSHAIADAYLTCPRCGAEAGLPQPVTLEDLVFRRSSLWKAGPGPGLFEQTPVIPMMISSSFSDGHVEHSEKDTQSLRQAGRQAGRQAARQPLHSPHEDEEAQSRHATSWTQVCVTPAALCDARRHFIFAFYFVTACSPTPDGVVACMSCTGNHSLISPNDSARPPQPLGGAERVNINPILMPRRVPARRGCGASRNRLGNVANDLPGKSQRGRQNMLVFPTYLCCKAPVFDFSQLLLCVKRNDWASLGAPGAQGGG